MNSGDLYPATPAALKFAGSLFQWQGGTMGALQGFGLTNLGTLNVSGPVGFDNYFVNSGTIIESGAGNVGGGGAFGWINSPGAVYDIQNDNGLGLGHFSNYGLLKKSAGTGTSTVYGFANQAGSVEVDSGTLNINGAYVQGGGALTIKLGGNSAGQAGQLSINGSATLSGPLTVSLTNGFTPAVGYYRQIVAASAGLSGRFTTVNIPAGMAVTYDSMGAYMTMTNSNTVPAQIVTPHLVGDRFSFGFSTAALGVLYTVEQTTNLAFPNWTIVTNLSGYGGVCQISIPVSTNAMQFFRIVESTNVLPIGLVARYTFESNGNDLSGNSNNAVVANNILYQPGEAGLAAVFDGSSSYFDIPESPSLILTGPMTIAAWVNPANENNFVALVDKDYNYLGYTFYLAYNQVFMQISSTSSSSRLYAGNVPVNTWSHIAGVYDGSQILIYVNGVLVGQTPAGGLSNCAKDLYIGMYGSPGSGRYFPGLMDNVRIYNRALSAAEVQNLSTTGQ
jgi:hypothetical protein